MLCEAVCIDKKMSKILETLIHLILPVRRVDQSKTECDEDNKVRQWTGITPLHLSPSVFFQSLSVFTVSFSFTALISSSIFLSAFSLFYNADTSVSSFHCHCCAVKNVALSPETSEKPKSRTIKENICSGAFQRFLAIAHR